MNIIYCLGKSIVVLAVLWTALKRWIKRKRKGMNVDTEITGKIKRIDDFYVKFGNVEHQSNKATSYLEIIDWVQTNDKPGQDVYAALKCFNNNHILFNGKNFVEIGYQDLNRIRTAEDIFEGPFFRQICQRILLLSLTRGKDPLYFMYDPKMKITEERRALITHFNIPVTIVQTIM